MEKGDKHDEPHFAKENVGRKVGGKELASLTSVGLAHQKQHGGGEGRVELGVTKHVDGRRYIYNKVQCTANPRTDLSWQET